MTIALAFSETKSSISLTNEGKGTAGYILDDAKGTLDEADGTLDYPKITLNRETKSSVSLSNELK